MALPTHLQIYQKTFGTPALQKATGQSAAKRITSSFSPTQTSSVSAPAPAPAPTQDTSSNDLADIARRALESKLAGINARLAAMREEGTRQIGVAGGIKDELINNVTNRFAGLETEAGVARGKADAALGEEDRGVVRDYAKSQGSLNRSSERAEAKNRSLARATGIGNSSFYADQQSNLNSSLVDKTAGLQNEEDSKLAGIKQRVSEVATWFEQKKTDLAHEAATLKSQAERAYQDQVGKIQFAQQTYGIDQEGAAEQAQLEFEGKLASISQYIADKANQAQQIASSAAQQAASIQGLQAVDPRLSGILAQNSGMEGATQQATINGSTAPTTAPKERSLWEKYITDPWNEYLYGGSQQA